MPSARSWSAASRSRRYPWTLPCWRSGCSPAPTFPADSSAGNSTTARRPGVERDDGAREAMTGRLYVGTSGFGYPAWVPRFYPPGTRAADLLPAYAARLAAVELNGTYYRSPSPATIAGWLTTTPP